MSDKKIKEGDKAKVSPVLTGEKDWIEGEVCLLYTSDAADDIALV